MVAQREFTCRVIKIKDMRIQSALERHSTAVEIEIVQPRSSITTQEAIRQEEFSQALGKTVAKHKLGCAGPIQLSGWQMDEFGLETLDRHERLQAVLDVRSDYLHLKRPKPAGLV